MERPDITIICILLIIVVLTILRQYVTSELIPLNVQTDVTTTRLHTLRRQNILIEDEILYYEALTTIQDEAVRQGFVPVNYYFLK